MPKRCPPGVFCIENNTIIILICITLFVWYFIYGRSWGTISQSVPIRHNDNVRTNERMHVHSNERMHVHSNERPILYMPQHNNHPIPINIQTSNTQMAYEQIGILTRHNGDEMILPLMGRSINTSRDSWNFYTSNENGIRIPLSVNGKSGMSEYGCDNVYNGDVVYVEGYNDTFTVTRYETDTLRYIG